MDEQIAQAQSKVQNRFNENLEFFKKHIPTIYKQLIDSNNKSTLALDPNSLMLFKTADSKPIYAPNPFIFAQNEVEAFLSKMNRSDYRPNPSGLLLRHLIKDKPFLKTVEKYSQTFANSEQKKPSHADLVIFGVGLGHHIEILCNKALFFHLIIIEKDINNFKESLYTINWSKILRELTKNRKISFIINDTKQEINDFHRNIQLKIQDEFPSITSSTLIYNHINGQDYSDEKKIIENLINYINVVYEKIGPDAQRLMNLNENIKRKYPVINLDKTKINSKDAKIVIVGAGPSLDSYLEILKSNRDRLFIISAGSSLSSLLKKDIKPDYHFELEFKNLANNLLSHLNKSYNLKEINLIANLESNPMFLRLFNDVHTFIPETTELSNRLGSDYILPKGGITCTNGATAFATKISNADIFLVGLDFAQTGGEHHAKENITNQTNLPKDLSELEKDGKDLRGKATLEVQDVFGEMVKTTPSLNAARLLMQTLINSNSNVFYNCSYGAKIEGANHVLPEDLNLALSNYKPTSKISISFIENVFEPNSIHNMTREILDISFDVSNQITTLINEKNENYNENICTSVINISNKIRAETGSQIGQYRSIMSINRLPLYLLYTVANYTDITNRSSVVKTWISDYTGYIEYIKSELYSRLDSKEFLVLSDWTDD